MNDNFYDDFSYLEWRDFFKNYGDKTVRIDWIKNNVHKNIQIEQLFKFFVARIIEQVQVQLSFNHADIKGVSPFQFLEWKLKESGAPLMAWLSEDKK